jgi:hypothetical protein
MVLATILLTHTGSGNGCNWYFTNHSLDCVFGTVFNYVMFAWVDQYAVKNGVDSLKSGMYFTATAVEPDVKGKIIDMDEHLDFSIWCL